MGLQLWTFYDVAFRVMQRIYYEFITLYASFYVLLTGYQSTAVFISTGPSRKLINVSVYTAILTRNVTVGGLLEFLRSVGFTEINTIVCYDGEKIARIDVRTMRNIDTGECVPFGIVYG